MSEEKAKPPAIIGEMTEFRDDLFRYTNVYFKAQKPNLSYRTKKALSDAYLKLSTKLGALEPMINELSGMRSVDLNHAWINALNLAEKQHKRQDLNLCLQATTRAIGKLEDDIKNGIRDKETGLLVTPQTKMTTEAPKAFIAHEGETKALGKLKAFLDALGVTYLMAEIEPSNGRLVEGQVDWSQGQADFAIILATKGKVVNKETGKPQIGTNVADELGRARQVFKNRIILLRQTGVEVHTNVSGIVRERFSPNSMDKAFIKIAKELKNWHLIRASKVEE